MQRGIREVKAALLDRLEEVVKFLYPGATVEKSSAFVGNNPDGTSRKGERAKGSLVVTLSGSARGACKDYGSDWKGDVLSLWQLARGVTLQEALQEAGRYVGFSEFDRPKPPNPPPTPRLSGVGRITQTPIEEYLRSRGISLETLKKYKIRSHKRQSPDNEHFICFRFYGPDDPHGKAVMMKSVGIAKRPDGRKDIWSTEPFYTLWGWWLIDANTRSIIITEGEIDAMSVAEMLPPHPVLSLPAGASNDQWIENDFHALQRFEHIYLCFDADSAGQEAVERVAHRLGRHRCYRMLPGNSKDANDALLAGDRNVFDWIENAVTIDPDDLVGVSQLRADAHRVLRQESQEREKRTFIFPELPYCYRDGECSLVTGYPGGGKSQWLYQSHLHEMANGKKVCVASMEITAPKMLNRLAQQLHQASLTSSDMLDEALDWLDGKLWFRARVGILKDWKPLLDDFYYAMQRYGCTRFVIDSLLYAVPKDDYSGQDNFCSAIKAFCNETATHVALVAHAQAKGNEDRIPGMGDVLGSNGITAPFDNGISLWRNIYLDQDEEMVPKKWKGKTCDGVVACWKQRTNGKLFRRDLFFHEPSESFSLAANESPPRMPDFALKTNEDEDELF